MICFHSAPLALMQSSLHKYSTIVGLGALVLVAVLLSGCGSTGTPEPTSTPTQETVVLTLRPLLGSSDLAVGRNRFVFALLGSTGAPMRATAADLALSYVEGDTPVSYSRADAVFRQWPAGPGGVFTAQVDFSRADTWIAEITPLDGEADGELGRLAFEVKEQSATPALGSPAPPSQTRTVTDVAELDELTTDSDLYAVTIAQALELNLPMVVTFATPAFCTSATCGPQVDVVKDLKGAFGHRASFIHVEIYANPKEIQGDLSKAQVAPAVLEWGLPSEPWTFVVDAQGRVAAKFEAFTSYEELEEALEQVLLS